ncbi:MAG: hypothetical protein Kow0025_12760 [Thermodesulfovibrionales bacterium]
MDGSFQFDTAGRHNPAGAPRSRRPRETLLRPGLVSGIFPLLMVLDMKNKAPLKKTTGQQIGNLYEADILGLQGLTGRDLSAWRE